MVCIALIQKHGSDKHARTKTTRTSWTSRAAWTARPTTTARAAFGLHGLPLIGRERQVKLPHVRQIEESVAVQAHDRRCAGHGLLQSENGAEQRQQQQAAERGGKDPNPAAPPSA